MALICIALLTGCTRTETASPGEEKGALKESLSIGLIPERNIFEQMERYEPLAAYLSDRTDRQIKLQVLTRYGNIVDNFVSAGLDGAFFGSFTYTLAHARLGVEPLARPESLDGISSYHGLIFVRKDSGIKTAADMKGKVFAFVDKATTAGHLLPMAYFKENGIDNYHAYFKETYYAGTHEDVIYDVLDRRADVGAAKNTVFDDVAKRNSYVAKELVIIKTSPDVPQNALAMKKDIDHAVRNKLKEVLLNMHNDPEGRYVLRKFGSKRFIETTDRDYEGVYKYVNKLGLDLKAYDYMNE